MRVNNDVILGLTTAQWSLACMTELQPQCDISIDPHIALPISVRSNRHQQRDPSHLLCI